MIHCLGKDRKIRSKNTITSLSQITFMLSGHRTKFGIELSYERCGYCGFSLAPSLIPKLMFGTIKEPQHPGEVQ